MKNITVNINDIQICNDKPLVLIGGPDSLESMNHALFMAKSISKITNELGIPYIFKASYDKGNRTSVNTFRGVGLKNGLKIFSKIKKELGIPITTDIHSKEEASQTKEIVDLIQIPALLSRQTDILVAAGLTGKAVNIKKGQFIAPGNIENAINKVTSTGNKKVMVTERGYTFGYNDVVADMRSLAIMKETGYPVIFDASHTVQTPSSKNGKSGGDRTLISPLARAAAAVGISGIFMEIHDNPDKAPVDGQNSLNLKDLRGLLKTLKDIDNVVKS